MAEKKQQTEQAEPEEQVYEQLTDPHGRTRLDRPLNGEEAAAQNEANSQRNAEEVARRFEGRVAE
jgi:hypothetical protein